MSSFRIATAADVDPILELMRQYYAEDGYPLLEAQSRRALLDLIEHDDLGRLWVAQREGAVAGYLAVTLGFSLEYRGRDAFVDELYIAESARGQGLGTQALRIAEEFCRAQGVNALHLEVEIHRAAARELYRRSGFENHQRDLMTKWLGDPHG